ncbi:serine/threonine-protein kinase [Pseudonocardia endophytica]|uniref:non-specific serine/threonine protein kinase n=1 Tax=Pseudonocardia endophytica TaxID=401976 RepID=A0A4R1HPE1_PSEEN|nr:serine/threonine-protein kinase [Pseudonocardia endophytica]TCK23013.1 serine/threonine protein kinase [Pseudonocardia endophytica]
MDEAGSFGPYRVGELLGRGGMGTVHRAFDTRRERTVALKRLNEVLADDPRYRERFRRECRLAARLSSPHVVPIHDFGEIDGVLFLDMRLVDGRGLDTLLGDGPLPPERAVRTVEQVAHALDAAHAAGLVHRDVKPSNVLVGEPDGFVHLADFGIARSVDPGTGPALTGSDAAPGTLAYLAPEVVAGATADRRADVYALACVLYETLTGRRPFDGAPAQLLHHHLHTPPPDPAAARPDLPSGLSGVVRDGMAKDPAARPSSAGELARRASEALRPDADDARRAASAPQDGRPGPDHAGPDHAGHGQRDRRAAGPPRRPDHATAERLDGTAPCTLPVPADDSSALPQADGTPPAESVPPAGEPPRSRRIGVVVTVVVAVAILVGAALVTAVLTGQGATPPAAAAPADTTTLRLAFPEIGRRGCVPSPALTTSAGHTADAVLACDHPRTRARAEFVEWASADDAALAVRDAGAGRTSYESEWKIALVPQGPVYFGEDGAGGWVAVGAYRDERFGFRVHAQNRQDLSGTFRDMQLVTADQLPS